MTILELKNIYKSFGKLNVLNNINLSINQGDTVSIVGPSGAGKSTLLHIIGTLDTPDQGEVFFKNQSLTKLKDQALSKIRNLNLGFVFQFHHLMSEFTAIENICIPAFIKGENKKKVLPRAQNLMQRLGIESKENQKINKLSGGEKQRIAVCRALINNPDLILADEPSGNLDSKSAKDLHDLFHELSKELNKTFIIVTHNLELARQTNKLIQISDGKIIEN